MKCNIPIHLPGTAFALLISGGMLFGQQSSGSSGTVSPNPVNFQTDSTAIKAAMAETAELHKTLVFSSVQYFNVLEVITDYDTQIERLNNASPDPTGLTVAQKQEKLKAAYRNSLISVLRPEQWASYIKMHPDMQ